MADKLTTLAQMREAVEESKLYTDAESNRAKAEEQRLEDLFTTPTQEAVNNWLNAHPEATTTVQDGSITMAKLAPAVAEDVASIDDLKSALNDLAVVIPPGEVVRCFVKQGQTVTFRTVDGSNFINNGLEFYDENMTFIAAWNMPPSLSSRTIDYDPATTARYVKARAQTVDVLLYPAFNVFDVIDDVNNEIADAKEQLSIATETIYEGAAWEVEQSITAVGQYATAEYNFIPKGTKITVYVAEDHAIGGVSFNIAGKDMVYLSLSATVPFTAVVPFDVYYSRSYCGQVGKCHLIVETSAALNDLSDVLAEFPTIKSDPKLNQFFVNQSNTTINGVIVKKITNNAIKLNGTASAHFNLNISFGTFDLKKHKTVTFMMDADKDLSYSTFYLQLGYFKAGNVPVGLEDKVYLNDPYTITFPNDAESLRAYLHTANPDNETETVIYNDVTVSFYAYYDLGSSADVELKENLQGNSFNSTLHDGLTDYVELATKFSLLMSGDTVNNVAAVSDCEAFLFFTDPHTQSGGYSAKFIEYMGQIQKMYHSTPCNFVLCGGDWLGNSDTPDVACYKMGMLGATCRSMLKDCYMIVGNHDTNYQGKKDSSSSVYTTRLPNESISNLWYQGKKAYYDFNGSTTKFYVFDTGIEAQTLTDFNNYGYEQAEWFANSLRREQSEHIAVAMHMYYTDGIATTPVWSQIGHLIMQIAAAYNARSTVSVNGTQYDFSNVASNGKVEFAIAGHTHEDLTYRFTENGADIPVLITVDTGYHSTYPENASFDLVFVDYDNRIIKTVRVGSGSDRQIALSI